MGYQSFAYYYDAFNGEADYERLCAQIIDKLKINGVHSGIVADLGCGTGEVTLRLVKNGYELISVDASGDMLAVLREKLDKDDLSSSLLLQQNLTNLDLFGTVSAAVCTFDTFNHIAPDEIERVLERIALFLEPGGILIFDANTPYKHKHILGDFCFEIETTDGLLCVWQNQLHDEKNYTKIELDIYENDELVAQEQFNEYIYTLDDWMQWLKKFELTCIEVLDGETFLPLEPCSQRYFFTCKK